MAALGFKRLADLEIAGYSDGSDRLFNKPIIRSFVSSDGSVLGDYCVLKPKTGRLLKMFLSFRWILAPKKVFKAYAIKENANFETEFSDGTFITTNNTLGGSSLSSPPSVRSERMPRDTPFEVLLARHKQRVTEYLENTPDAHVVQVHSVDDMLAMEQRLHTMTVAYRSSVNWITLEELTAMANNNSATAFAIYQEIQTLTGGNSTSVPADQPMANLAEQERDVFLKQLESKPNAGKSARAKFRTTCLTALAFIAVATAIWSLNFALILLAVIAVHEGGHFLAMLACGYRNLNVFFIPGLGGIATGHKESVPTWQAALIYLAGPLPGIVLAILALKWQRYLPDDSIWREPLASFSWISLVINYLNLLPIVPLDGGRIVERLLFNRWPWARFAFALLSLFGLVGLAWAFSDRVLAIVCIFLGSTIPFQGRVARLVSRYRKQFGGNISERREIGERLFTLREKVRIAKGQFLDETRVAKSALAALQLPVPRWRDALSGLVLYIVLLFGSPIAAFVALLDKPSATSPADIARPTDSAEAKRKADVELAKYRAQAAQELERKLRAAKSDEERWDVLMLGSDDDSHQHEAYEAAWKIASQWPAGNPRRIKTLIAMSEAYAAEREGTSDEKNVAKARESIDQAKKEIRDAKNLEAGERAELLFRLFLIEDVKDLNRIQDLENAYASIPADHETEYSYSIRDALAKLRFHAGRFDEAQRLVMQNYQKAQPWERQEAAADLLYIMVARGQMDEAQKFSDQAMQPNQVPAGMYSLTPTLAKADFAAVKGDWKQVIQILETAERESEANAKLKLPWYFEILIWMQGRYYGVTKPVSVPLELRRLEAYVRSNDARAAELTSKMKIELKKRAYLQNRYCRVDAAIDQRDFLLDKPWRIANDLRIGRSLQTLGLCGRV
jgi:Zn-dependent protease